MEQTNPLDGTYLKPLLESHAINKAKFGRLIGIKTRQQTYEVMDGKYNLTPPQAEQARALLTEWGILRPEQQDQRKENAQ